MEVATILMEDYYRPQPGTARATQKRMGNMPRLMINADAKPANPTSSDPAEMERIRRCRWLPPLSEAAKSQRGPRKAATLKTKAGAAGDRLIRKAATGAAAVKDHFPQSDIRKSQTVKKLCRVNPHTQFLEKLRQAHLVAARLRQKALEAVQAENTMYNWAAIRRFSRDNEYGRFFQNLGSETGTTVDVLSDVANPEVQQRLVRTAESTTGPSCASAPPHGFGASDFALTVHEADGANGRFASAGLPAATAAAPATGVASRSTGMDLPAGSRALPPALNFAHGYAPLPQRYWAEFAQKKRRSLRPRKPNDIPWDGLHDAPGAWQQSAPEPDVEASEEYGRTYEEVMELKGLLKEKRHACENEFRKFDLETTAIKQLGSLRKK